MSQEICRSSVLLWSLLFKAVSISSAKSIHAEISIIILWLWVNLDQWIMIHQQRFACHDLLIKKIMIAFLNINNHETRTSVNFLHCSLTMGESWWVKNSQHTTFKTTFKNPGFAQSSKITWQIHHFDELNVCYHGSWNFDHAMRVLWLVMWQLEICSINKGSSHMGGDIPFFLSASPPPHPHLRGRLHEAGWPG